MTTFKNIAVGRLKKTVLASIGYADVRSALNDLNADKKARLVQAVQRGRKELVGRIVLDAVSVWADSQAKSSYDTAMSDGVVSSSELDSIFGGQ